MPFPLQVAMSGMIAVMLYVFSYGIYSMIQDWRAQRRRIEWRMAKLCEENERRFLQEHQAFMAESAQTYGEKEQGVVDETVEE